MVHRICGLFLTGGSLFHRVRLMVGKLPEKITGKERDVGDGRPDILDMVESMPAFPVSVHRVLALTSDINSNPKELVAVIEHDPVLIMKILKLVNSPYFGLSRRITSVNHAIVTLGLNTVKNLALSTAALGILPRKHMTGFDLDAFLLHSLATATIAKLLAKKLRVEAREHFDYFLAGLLHDFGKIVFAHAMPTEFHKALLIAKERKMPLHEAEKEIFNIDHTGVSLILAEKWNLPVYISESMRRHHVLSCDGQLLTDAVIAANEISKSLNIGTGGNDIIAGLPESIGNLFGMEVEPIVATLGNVREETENAMVFATL